MNVIVLATYNGARYLPELLASIRRQTFTAWRLLVRDDGSTDGTRALLEQAAVDDARIQVLADDGARLGPAGNFGRLLQRAFDDGATTVSCADQDDVWLPQKLERQQAELRRLADLHGAATPLLVHSDLTVVDGELRILHRSFAQFARVHRDVDDPLGALLVANCVTGCTLMVNRALLGLALPMPAEARMHDWWLALCAAALGRIGYLPDSTVLYRQHGENAVGAIGLWSRFNPLDGGFGSRWRRGLDDLRKTTRQMQAFRDRLLAVTGDPRHHDVRRLSDYCQAFESPTSSLGRWRQLRQVGYARAGILRQALLAARLWSLRRRAA